jgi:hypothetical protein
VVGSPVVAKTEATKADWPGLWQRLQRRCITALELLQIMVLDAVILLAAGFIFWLFSTFAPEGNAVLQAGKKLSHGMFLILYTIVVFFDVVGFFKNQRRASKQEK